MSAHTVYVVEGPKGFTETLPQDVVELIETMGLIRFEREAHVMVDGSGNGVGPLHRFYVEADR